MFGTDKDEKVLAEIQGLRKDLAALKGERAAVREEISLADQVKQLKTEIATLEINRDKLTETHAREKREVEHMVGLEKKRQTFEIESSKRDATLTIREENLAADRTRFETQLAFHDERFKAEVKYLKDLMGQVLDRLPTVTVDKQIGAK